MSERGREDTERTKAEVRRSWWPGWIWAVPLAAILIGAWLLFRHFTEAGTGITIVFTDAHGLKPKDTSIEYRGMQVGTVNELSLTKNGKAVRVSATIDGVASKYLTTGTQFWMQGASTSLTDLGSLSSLLSGPTIVMQPGLGKPATHFTGLTHKPPVAAHHGPPVLYTIAFEGAVGDLEEGAPIKLDGFAVGEIEQIGFRYDRQSGALATPVTVGLYPEAFHLQSKAELNAALVRLVQEGLRARLDREPPLIGSYRVSLEMMPGAPNATVTQHGNLPEIPVAPGGGLNAILTRLNKVPIDQIGQNVLDITHHLDALVSSPQLKDSVVQLDQALRQVHRTAAQIQQTAAKAGPQITQLVAQLRGVANQIDQAARAAEKTLGATPAQSGLQSTMKEITEAARSVRDLADYLDRHPESLIKGKSGD